MAYLAICRDAHGSVPLREQHKTAHFEYIKSIMDSLLIAGPCREACDGNWCASVFIYDTDDPEVARGLLENDPYFCAGIYADVEWISFLPAAGSWIGGGLWGNKGDQGET